MIDDLCCDEINAQTQSASTGATMGVVESYTNAASNLRCNAQEASAREVRMYDATGQRRFWQFFFPSDPSITLANRILVVKKGGVTLSTPIVVRVLDHYSEGRPGEDFEWVVEGEEVTTRKES